MERYYDGRRKEGVYDLVRILQDVVKSARDGKPQCNIWLDINKENSSVKVYVDEKKLREEVNDYLTKALEYNAASDVTIHLEKGEMAYISGSPFSSEQPRQENNLTHWLALPLYEE